MREVGIGGGLIDFGSLDTLRMCIPYGSKGSPNILDISIVMFYLLDWGSSNYVIFQVFVLVLVLFFLYLTS